MAMLNCKQLGFVSGDAGLWGGTGGLNVALADAKNKAAKYPGANAILVTSSRMNPVARVNATVYNCSDAKPRKIEIVNSQQHRDQRPEITDETIRKARKCQQKGGVWMDGLCVLDID